MIILSKHRTRTEALEKEKDYQVKRNVVRSPFYINKSVAIKNGFFGMDVSGKNNPNYGNKWSDEQKSNMSVKIKELHENGVLKPWKVRYGKDNSRYKDGKTTFKDSNGNFVFTHKDDPRVKNGELVGVGTNVAKCNETKSKNKNMKKYSYIILKEPDGTIVTLNWNEYHAYFDEKKLSNFVSCKKTKGYVLLEAKLNPDWKIKPPVKKKSS